MSDGKRFPSIPPTSFEPETDLLLRLAINPIEPPSLAGTFDKSTKGGIRL